MFATIGEEFADPEVMGIVLSIRAKEDVLSVWYAFFLWIKCGRRSEGIKRRRGGNIERWRDGSTGWASGEGRRSSVERQRANKQTNKSLTICLYRNSDTKNHGLRYKIGEKLKEIWQLGMRVVSWSCFSFSL